MRIALAQINPTVGDLLANAQRVETYSHEAAKSGANLICFPELALTGYPPRDLLAQEGFIEAAAATVARIAQATAGLTGLHIVLGCPWKPPARDGSCAPDAFDTRARPTNSLVVLHGGRITHRCDKRLLPTYDVFDEDRYFEPGTQAVVVDIAGHRIGLSICEDLWRAVDIGADVAGVGGARYADQPDPMDALIAAGATIILNPSASPFVAGKGARQRDIIRGHVARHGVTIAAVNQVGANDDLIFDGHSIIIAPSASGGQPPAIAAAPGFVEHLLIADLAGEPVPVADPLLTTDPLELLYRALVLGIRDYARKTGFRAALLGVSGGIDSALTAALVVAALGPDAVTGVAMPSRHSSDHSVADARALCKSLRCRYTEIPIDPAHAAMEQMVAPVFAAQHLDPAPGLAEENLQSRIRGTMLMAISNKTGALLVTTGNKSEYAVGYCTLYGDMNGGLAVLCDLCKSDVYALSRWINTNHARLGFAEAPIPEGSITKPPSAELRPGQLDQDSLPPYDVLDEIVRRYVEHHQSPATIAAEAGFDSALVAKFTRMIDLAEYKRHQMPVGLKVTAIAFGRGRRMPIVNGFRPPSGA